MELHQQFTLGETVVVFQNTKSSMPNPTRVFVTRGYATVIALNSGLLKDRHKVKMHGSDQTWHVHPQDMRKLTKLERALK